MTEIVATESILPTFFFEFKDKFLYMVSDFNLICASHLGQNSVAKIQIELSPADAKLIH